MTPSAASCGHKILTRGLKAVGKDYRPDPDLPATLIASVAYNRATWLVRGLLRLRRPAYLGPGVRLRGKANLTVGRNCSIERHVYIDGYARDGVNIGARTRLGAFSVISCTSHLSRYGAGFSIGHDSGLGEFSFVGAAGGVRIGDNVIMGQMISFHSQEHVFTDTSVSIRVQGTTERGITIGDDCWVGARVTFLDGSEVGSGSVVAAGAVVRGTFPPFSVIAGVPARLVQTRDRVASDSNA